jgi:uridine phosphorylase
MTIPNVKGKHKFDSFFSPEDYLKYLRGKNLLPKFDAPEGIVFCYQSSLLNHVLESHEVEKVEVFAGEFYLIKDINRRIGICAKFGIGAPIVTTILEEAIITGTKKFLSIGSAGSLQKDLKIGDIVVCNNAIRDEGVSHHYISPSKYATPSVSLTKKLEETLIKAKCEYRVGSSWTIDAPYRETVQELQHYREEGVLTVEMEASALFAVAQYRKVDLATAFVVSDILGDAWEPHLKSPELSNKLNLLFETSVEALLN